MRTILRFECGSAVQHYALVDYKHNHPDALSDTGWALANPSL